MHDALIAWRNPAAAATYDAAGWDAAAPVSLVTEPDGARARYTAPWSENSPVLLRGVFPVPEVVRFAGLFGTNLYQSHDVELRLCRDDAWSDIVWTSGRGPMLPALIDTAGLAFEDPRKFDGRLDPEDFFAWPANVHRFPTAVYCRSFEWRVWSSGIRPDLSESAGFEVDHVWLSDALPVELRAETKVTAPPSATTRREGGYTVVEPGGTPLRTATLPLSALDGGSADQLMTMARRVDSIRPVAFVFDVDDPALAFFYGFLARQKGETGRDWSDGPDLSDTTITLEEWS